MKNYREKIVLGLTLFFIAMGHAQPPGKERIKALKVGYLTDRLNLTSEEAQHFWPVYNVHEAAIHEIKREERQLFGEEDGFDGPIENATRVLSQLLELKEKQRQVHLDFINDLKDILPDEKIIKLMHAEEHFKRRLLRQIKKHRRPPE